MLCFLFSLSQAQASGALAPSKLEELKVNTAKAEARYKAAQQKVAVLSACFMWHIC